jgi:protein-S-isoprenylcysteine O-methyltransferase Ste14
MGKLLYAAVSYALFLVAFIVFWATPAMSLGHLVFALATTAYILVGVRLEERDLRSSLAEPYDEYRKDVRMLLPIPRRTR